MTHERLHKVMASCGIGSRRACETMIAEGRVEVDGEVVDTPGTLVDPETQQIRCDGIRLRREPRRYYLLNKPRGVICSQRAEGGKRRGVDLVPERQARLYTIGRLDVESEGALILTNDGDLCHRVTHPRFGIEKTYRVDVEGRPSDATITRMRKGVWLSEGRTGSVDVAIAKRGRHRSTLVVRLNEGMRREIRRLCARFGHEVVRLKRVAIGPVQLGRLGSGRFRELSPEEIAALHDSAQTVIRLGAEPRPARPPGRGGSSRGGSSRGGSSRGGSSRGGSSRGGSSRGGSSRGGSSRGGSSRSRRPRRD